MKKVLMATLAIMLVVMMMVGMSACSPAEEAPMKEEPAKEEAASEEAPAEEAAPTTWTSDAGNEYNLVAKEDIVIGFNQGSNTVDFLRMVGENIEEIANQEGIKFISTESNFDVEQILPNIDNLLAQGANVIVDFNVNAEVGGNLVDYCAAKGVPVIGVDVLYPSPTNDETSWFFGANNQMAGETAGAGLAEGVKERWGGEIDHLVLLNNSENGDLVMLRTSQMQKGLIDGGIDVPDDKVTVIEMGGGGSDTTVSANEKFTDWLAAHPDATKICVGAVNTETGQGVFSATVTSDRSDHVMLATNNNGNQTLAAWETPDAQVWLGGVVYKPGQYGEYIVPLVESLLAGENPDKMTTMDHAFLTINEIDAVREEMGVN